MMRYLFFLIMLFSGVSLFAQSVKNKPNCPEWEISEKISLQENGLFTLEIEVEGVTSTISYIVYEEKGTLVSQNFNSPVVTDLKAGKYGFTVSGKNGCRVSKDIEIK